MFYSYVFALGNATDATLVLPDTSTLRAYRVVPSGADAVFIFKLGGMPAQAGISN
jgi:hypothetical protein